MQLMAAICCGPFHFRSLLLDAFLVVVFNKSDNGITYPYIVDVRSQKIFQKDLSAPFPHDLIVSILP